MFSRCVSRLKTQAKGVLEANKGCIQRLNAVTTKKLKKEMIYEVKYSITIPLNSDDIDKIDHLAGNNKQRDAFFLECGKLIEIGTFRMITELEWLSELFQFCILYCVFDAKLDS